jgi:hypothetical protein
VLHQRKGNGVEALELRWSESERNDNVQCCDSVLVRFVVCVVLKQRRASRKISH